VSLQTAATPKSALWTIPIMFCLFLAGEFLALIHMGLALADRGMSGFGIGLVSSALWGGILLACLKSAGWAARWGTAAVMIWAAGLATLIMAVTALHDWYPGWIMGSFLIGLTNGAIWVLGESWLTQAAPAERRGMMVGLFETSVGIGMLTGPLLLPLSIGAGLPPLGLAASLMGTGFLVLLPLTDRRIRDTGRAGTAIGDDPADRQDTAPTAAATTLPLILVAALAGLLESGSSALLPPVSTRIGFSLAEAATLGAVVGAGSALLQTPFGLLADRIGTGRTILLAWAILILATAFLALTAGAPELALWPVAFAMGGVGGAVYTLIVIAIGHRLTGTELIQAMGWLIIAYALGSVSGPLIGGAIFDLAGFPALTLAFCAASLVGIASAIMALKRMGRI